MQVRCYFDSVVGNLKYYCSSGRFASTKVTCFAEDLRFLFNYEYREKFAMALKRIGDEAVKVYLYVTHYIYLLHTMDCGLMLFLFYVGC